MFIGWVYAHYYFLGLRPFHWARIWYFNLSFLHNCVHLRRYRLENFFVEVTKAYMDERVKFDSIDEEN